MNYTIHSATLYQLTSPDRCDNYFPRNQVGDNNYKLPICMEAAVMIPSYSLLCGCMDTIVNCVEEPRGVFIPTTIWELKLILALRGATRVNDQLGSYLCLPLDLLLIVAAALCL